MIHESHVVVDVSAAVHCIFIQYVSEPCYPIRSVVVVRQ